MTDPTSNTRIKIRRSEDRGSADHGWLKSFHTFSFAEYHDPDFMGFRSLRVVNEDRVAPGGGFPPHPHRDMEIFSYVVSGELEHRDSLGNERRLAPGQIQLMSAGSGVRHSEFNPSSTESAHFLQVWILPLEKGLQPSYTEWQPPEGSQQKSLIISPDGREGSAIIHQRVNVYRVLLESPGNFSHVNVDGRAFWFQIIDGACEVDGVVAKRGDAVYSEITGEFRFDVESSVHGLLFDLA